MRKTVNLFLVFYVLGTLLSLEVFPQSKLPASSIKTIYVVPSSHYDFGFVEPPSAIRERAARHIDEVIRVAEANKDFRWTIESVWQVNEWLKRQKKPSSVLPQDKEKIGRLMNLIKSGQIVLSTAWGSMHTDYLGAEELNRLNYDFVNLQRQYGITSRRSLVSWRYRTNWNSLSMPFIMVWDHRWRVLARLPRVNSIPVDNHSARCIVRR